ncbi:MAG: hypothetical protein H6815_05655 [Phycisphaeraceae bacterium]|nr:hypothetical protein [Phycisphaerales bacterium]MCB9859923.1 hypothetical protein [Phycisphaeraceae bacterium]
MDKLTDMAWRVDDRESFLAFVQSLIEDKLLDEQEEAVSPSNPYGPGSRGWENDGIAAFLEAAAAWMNDNSTNRNNEVFETASWQLFAMFLLGGKYYE